MEISEIAETIKAQDAKIILIYAFNTTGKTRLSVAFKDATKDAGTGDHAGVYYNAFSEDLFVWDNDTENEEQNIRLDIVPCSLNRFHSLLTEDAIREKLQWYKPRFDFSFGLHDDTEKGIEKVSFYLKGSDASDDDPSIKISRGEERIFVWCFFLALFEVEGWADQQSEHFFIDDPVSSLDDHNIFVTAATLFKLIEDYSGDRKIILTTHHIGFFSILVDWITKGEKSSKFKKKTQLYVLNRKDDVLTLESPKKNVFLYHLQLMQTLDRAKQSNELFAYHFALLRQVLENISSFLGVGQFSYVLDQIGISDTDQVSKIVNTLSHKRVYYYQSEAMNPDNVDLFNKIFDGLINKYNFVLHTGNP